MGWTAVSYAPSSGGGNKRRKGAVQALPCGGTGNEPATARGVMPQDMPSIPLPMGASAIQAQAQAQAPDYSHFLGTEVRHSTLSDCGLISLQSGDLLYDGGYEGKLPLSPLPFEFGGSDQMLFDMSPVGPGPFGALLPPERPLSSTGTGSPSESTASGTLSSVQLDFASEMSAPAAALEAEGGYAASTPRGPSPLCSNINSSTTANLSSEATTTIGNGGSGAGRGDGGGGYVCLAYKCEATFSRAEDLELHARTAHQHVCLWGSDGQCESAGFATRDELNWHVKKDHLLVCPVLGCKESAFQSKEVVDCHLKWVHGGDAKMADNNDEASLSSGLLRAPISAAAGPLQPDTSICVPGPTVGTNKLKRKTTGSSQEDRALKMQMSIGISKKRCRDQLRMVVEKRHRRLNGGTTRPSTGDSPGALVASSQTAKLVESASFPLIWEHGVLPFLIEFMPKWCGAGHVISVVRGKKPNTRRICIMTPQPVSRARRVVIAGHVRDLLPASYRSATAFVFSTGSVERLMVWARGLGKGMPDEVCQPRNPFCYLSPCMGDSIGVTLEDGDGITATLGPCLTIADGSSYWLANFHPFVEAVQESTEPVAVEHPSPDDRARCLVELHDALSSDAREYQLGVLTATSGYDLKTTRVSHDPYWEDCDKDPPLVVTDWSLISANTRQANLLRKFPSTTQRKETPITTTSPVTPGATVCSTGRTSGHQRGQICEIPAYVHGTKAGNGTGKATREWFIEDDPDAPDWDEDAWIRGGIGVQGDSGAGVVDVETHALVGQVWGRNKYFGAGPRHSFFTPMLDVIDDIQEKCGQPARPQLPQYRDEADRWPAYPVCRRCFDMREYLDCRSRRSSRESLMSMIGGCGGVGDRDDSDDRDHDLPSTISELATPKEHVRTPRDTATYLVRHVGPDEQLGGASHNSAFSPASLNSAVSPAPVHVFPPSFSLHSPGPAVEVRSPYAQTLDDGDLYDSKLHGGPTEVSLGKRPRTTGPTRSGSHQVEKRRRV